MRRVLAPIAVAVLACLPIRARAATEVHIKLSGQGGENRLPLGLPPFVAADVAKGEEAVLAKQLRDAVRDDLLLSRYFTLLEDGPLFNGANAKAIAADWKLKAASYLLTAKVAQSAGQLEASVQLTDLNSGDVVLDRYYRQDAKWLRAVAHRVSDDVVHQLTGKNGIARSLIAFANAQSGHKEIYVMDYDGNGVRALTHHDSISILPRFSPDRKSIAYTTYKEGNPDLFLLELEKGTDRAISRDQGLNVAGGFSPDGTELLMTLSRQKSPNLYLKNFTDGSVTQLTQHFGADSSPTFSPDSQQVAFVSDRSGNPQIYVLDLTTRRAKRLTSLNWCDSPSWSPTGEWIAFAGRAHREDKPDIYLVDVTGGQIRQLTHGESANENPTWSPDGRFLAFSTTRGKRGEIYVMDADGSAPHRLADIPGPSVTPDWSR